MSTNGMFTNKDLMQLDTLKLKVGIPYELRKIGIEFISADLDIPKSINMLKIKVNNQVLTIKVPLDIFDYELPTFISRNYPEIFI